MMSTQQRGQETRNRILDAALEAFAGHGYDAMGVAEICRRAVDPDLASYVLLAFAVGLLALGLLDPRGTDWGQVAQGGKGMLLEGIEASV